MKIRGAIFDLDGTILDSMGIWDTLGSDYLKTMGIEPPADLWETLKPMSLHQAACYFRSSYGLKDSVDDIMAQINSRIEDKYRYEIQPKPSALSFIRQLHGRGVKMCIATATDKHLAEAALQRLEILSLFCGVITCGEIGCGKDMPLIYFKALELLKTKIEETVIFEDALHAVITAKTAGFFVAGVHDDGAETDREEIIKRADWYIKSFDEWKPDD